jgi:carboxyl-terminal processing protease
VVVLTDRWSASMAEGFPMGLHGMGRARVVGTPMMQLGAAVFDCRLDRTGTDIQYSGEPVYDAMDRPRWLMRPDVEVTPSPAGDDNVLAAGVKELVRLVGLGLGDR